MTAILRFQDYAAALDWSRRLTSALSSTINAGLPEEERVGVFAYSIFYVFYEQVNKSADKSKQMS